jgi:hypothetical protein
VWFSYEICRKDADGVEWLQVSPRETDGAGVLPTQMHGTERPYVACTSLNKLAMISKCPAYYRDSRAGIQQRIHPNGFGAQ